MKPTQLFTLFTILVVNSLYAHKNVWRQYEFGNVKSYISAAFIEYEEITKAKIINELAYKLSLELKYNKPISLSFHHIPFDTINKTHYFLNISRGEFDIESEYKNHLLKKDGISLKFTGKHFDVMDCLKLVEYAIKNVAIIKESEKIISYGKPEYGYIKLSTIDTLILQNEILKERSTTLKKIAQYKISGPENDKNLGSGFTYYWQNDKYHVEHIVDGIRETVLSLDNISYFYTHNLWGNAIVFDSQFTFYTLKHRDLEISPRKTIIYKTKIEHHYGFDLWYAPYRVELIDGIRYIISSYGPQILKKRLILYWPEKDILIQDMDELLLSAKP